MHPWKSLSRDHRRRHPPTRPRATLALILVFCLGHLPATAAAANDSAAGLNARRYSIDPFRSFLEFSLGFMKIKTAEGTFHDYAGTIMYSAEDLARSSVTAVIRAESIFTGVKPRDNHLRSADFFDVDRYPHIVFTSTGLRPRGAGWILGGRLTLHGITRPIEISVFQEAERDGRLVFRGECRLKRRDYGVIGNFWGNKVLGNEVTVQLHVEAAPVEDGTFSPPRLTPRSLADSLLEAALDADPSTFPNAYRWLQMTTPDQYDFHATGLLELAVKLQRQGQSDAALRVLRFNLENFPDHTVSRDYLGYLQALDGRVSEALQTYRELLRMSPYEPGALEMLRWLSERKRVQARSASDSGNP